MATLAVASVGDRRWPSDVAMIGYTAGVFALGAHAVGHEYGHRTLPALLAQPVSRGRLFGAKSLVLGAMLTSLAMAAAVSFMADGLRVDDATRMVILPILGGVFTAPLFTMLCRSTLAGAVLGPSAPMTLWVLIVLAAWWGFAIDVDTTAAWFLDRWLMVAAIACPIFAMVTWRRFSRMEALEGVPTTLTLPRWMSGRAGSRRPAPWRALVAKELHLQQMTIAIALLYGVMWSIGVAVRQSAPTLVALPVEAVLLLYCMGLTIVIGALASAEERQQGTLDIQLLQPVGALGQWAVKCAVALGLALLLGLIVPAVLIVMFANRVGSNPVGISIELALLVILLTCGSLYISSLTSSGVKAMAWSVPAGIAAAIFIQTTRTAIAAASTQLGTPLPADQTEASLLAARVSTLLTVPALVWFGFVNHTSAEHPLPRTLTQIGTLAFLIAAGIVTAGALM
jgi:ABC-type transport system involved in multi-copper enzyme maturation permease subunit